MAFSGTGVGGTSQSYTTPSEWYDQYLADLTALGGSLAKTQYTPYKGPRIAEFTADQQAAFGGVKDAVGDWKPYSAPALSALTAGSGGLSQMYDMTKGAGDFNYYATAPTSGGNTGYTTQTIKNADGTMTTKQVPINFTPTGGVQQNVAQPGEMAYDQFYDVYQPTINKMQQAATSIGKENFDNTVLKTLNDNFTGTGQFGSGRHQILGADAAAAAQADIEKQIAGLEMQGKTQAMQDYGNWNQQQGQMGAQMGNYASNQARMGTDLMNFGLGQQQASMADAAALGNIGTQQQQMNQQNLNMAYQDFQEQQQYPWQQLDKWSSLTRGQSIPNYQSQVNTPAVTAPTQINPWVQGAQGAGGAWGWANTAFK